MKYLAVVLIAFAAFVAADDEWKPITDKETLLKLHEDCKKEHGHSTELALCDAVKVGIFSEDKGFNLDRLMAMFEALVGGAERVREDFIKCIDNNEEKSSAAEWASRGQQCMARTKIAELVKEKREAESANVS